MRRSPRAGIADGYGGYFFNSAPMSAAGMVLAFPIGAINTAGFPHRRRVIAAAGF